MRYLFMCKSLTNAQRASRSLESHGIYSGIIKAPQSVSGNGCGYSVSVSFERGRKATDILRKGGLLQGKIFEQNNGGELREVLL